MITELKGLNLRITEMRHPEKAFKHPKTIVKLKGRWRIHDRDNRVLGDIRTDILGEKLPLFVPLPVVAEEGISSDFLLEIGTAITIICRELSERRH